MAKNTKEGGGLDRWMEELVRRRLASPQAVEEFHRKNNNKEEEMRRRHLSLLNHYGTFDSIEEIRTKLADLSNPNMIVRAKRRRGEEVKRVIGTDLTGVCEFVEDLPDGIEAWVVEVKEYDKTTVASGTIIISPSGLLLIETWRGPHLMNVDIDYRQVVWGKLDPDNHERSWAITWSGPSDADDLKGYAVSALRYLCPHLRPKEDDPVYAEYCIRQDGSVYFIDVSDTMLLTGWG